MVRQTALVTSLGLFCGKGAVSHRPITPGQRGLGCGERGTSVVDYTASRDRIVAVIALDLAEQYGMDVRPTTRSSC